MPQTTIEDIYIENLNQSVNAMLEQPKPLSEKKKQKKFKGWKKTLLRIVFPVRVFSSSGSKKGEDSNPNARDLKAILANTDATITSKSPAWTSHSDNRGALPLSSSAAVAATAVSQQLNALTAPKNLFTSSSRTQSLTANERNTETRILSLSLPTPTIPTITITPNTPISTFPPMDLNMNSDVKKGEEEAEGERTEKQRDVSKSSISAPFSADYFGFALETHSTPPVVGVQGEERPSSSSTSGPVFAASSCYANHTIPPPINLSPARTAVLSETEYGVDEAETGDKKNKKKNKKTKKGTNSNPSNLIGQVLERSPNPLNDVKKGIITATSASVNVGSIVNSRNNAVSTLASSAPVSALVGANKLTNSLALKRKDFDMIIPIGPVAFILKGHVERANLEIDAAFHVKVGFVTHKLGKVQGNLLTGVRIKFGLSGVLTGQARFYMPVKGEKGKKKGKGKGKDQNKTESQVIVKEKENDGERSKWLWLDIKVTVFKEDIGPLSLPLVPIRFGNHKKTDSEARSVRSISISIIEDGEDGSCQFTTVRRSTSITTTTAGPPKSIQRYPNHLSQLEAFSFSSSDGFVPASLIVYPEPTSSYDYDEEEEVKESEIVGVGFMVGYHS